jgi:hypothetical protein
MKIILWIAGIILRVVLLHYGVPVVKTFVSNAIDVGFKPVEDALNQPQ